METVRDFEVESLVQDSDSDSEEIFFGPITKREIKSKLIYYNLYNDELLEPLQKLQDNDVLDDSLIRYYEDVFPKGTQDNSWVSRCASVLRDQDVDLDNDNIESAASTGVYKDSLELTDSESLIESELLQKYASHTTEQRLFVENEEIENDLEQINKNHTINLEDLRIDEKKSVGNTSENSNIYLKSEMLHSSADPISISINSTSDKSESISLHSSPEKSEYLKSDNSDIKCTSEEMEMFQEKSEYSYLKSDNSDIKCTSEEMEMFQEKSEYSYSKSDTSGFNCTLEEMEMFLKYGENYMTENKSPVNMKNDKVEIEDKENKSPIFCEKKTCNILNKSPFANKENQFLTPKPHRTFKENKENATPSPFKLPSKIITKKSPNYKNIVSPVAMYIKSTPKVPLVQNINKKPIHIHTFRDTSSAGKDIPDENSLGAAIGVLPVRCYKPATKTALLSQEQEPALPGSIKKHMKYSTPQVIKHVGRVQVHQVPGKCVQAQEQSKEEDMTMLSNSQSSIGDVSVYVSKNAVRTNRLLH